MKKNVLHMMLSLMVVLLLLACGNGAPKAVTASLDSISVDTTASLNNDASVTVHVNLKYFKGANAAALNDSLMRMGILQPNYFATSYQPLEVQQTVKGFVRQFVADYQQIQKTILEQEVDAHPVLHYYYKVDAQVLAGKGDNLIYIAHVNSFLGGDAPEQYVVVRNIDKDGRWIHLNEAFDKEQLSSLTEEVTEKLMDQLDISDTIALRKQGYFVDIKRYLPDNFMLFDDSVKFIYVPNEINANQVVVKIKL